VSQFHGIGFPIPNSTDIQTVVFSRSNSSPQFRHLNAALENLSFFWKNGSLFKMKILGCDKLPPLKGISPRDSGKVGLEAWAEKIWIDRIKKGKIEKIMKSILYASKVLNQGWFFIKELSTQSFYSNQLLKQEYASWLQRQGDAVMSKASSLGFSLLMKTSVVIDAVMSKASSLGFFLSCF
jgi:hypothetical protein